MIKFLENNSLLLCVSYFILMLIPNEVYMQIGDVRIEPYRIFLLILSLFVVTTKLMNYKTSLAEKFLLFYCCWALLSFIVNHGGNGIQSGLILFLEVFVGYSLGLLIKGNIRHLKMFLLVVLGAFSLLIPFAIAESLSGYRYLHVLAASIFNTPVEVYLGDQYFRHGLHRASTIFSHPILYSVCAVSILPLVFYFNRLFRASILSSGLFVAMVTSVTSAGFLMVAIQISLYTAKFFQKFIPSIFKILSFIFVTSFVLSSAFSNRGPVLLFIQFMSLNPATSYARYMQWQFASDDVFNNPILGIGFFDWSRPFWMDSSIDSFWLLATLQNGFPAALGIGGFFILITIGFWKEWITTRLPIYFAFFSVVFSIIFAGFTVDFFDRAQLFVFLIMGMFSSFFIKKKTSNK